MYRRSVNHLAIVVLRHPDSKAQLCKYFHHTSSFNNPQQDRFYLSTLLLYHTPPHPDQLHPARPTFTPTKKTTNRRSQSWSKIFKIAIFWSWYYSGEWGPRERSGWGKRESGEVQLLHKWGFFFNCHSIPFIFLLSITCHTMVWKPTIKYTTVSLFSKIGFSDFWVSKSERWTFVQFWLTEFGNNWHSSPLDHKGNI